MSTAALLSFLLAAVTMGALALLGRRLPGGGASQVALGWVDLVLALGAGLATMLLGAWVLGPASLDGGVVTGADFQEYCASVATLRGDLPAHHYAMRSQAPGLLPGLLAGPLGVVDGLALASLLGSGLVGAALYGWGRALHGRVAGLCAAGFGLAMPALAVAPRVLSFYPLITGLLVAATACATLAMRARTGLGLAVGGVGVALALLADGIGLIWALPCLAVVLVAALRAPRRRWPLRLALALLPVVLSLGVGRWAYAPTHPLETQLSIMVRTNSAAGPGGPPEAEVGGYRWGWSNPLAVPASLGRLWQRSRQAGQHLQDGQEVRQARARHVSPWLPLLAVALVPAALALRRRPWLLLALGLGCLPFAAMLQRAASMETNLRFLILSMPFVPLLLGLALAWALEGPVGAAPPATPASPAPRWARALRPGIALLLLALLILGPGLTPLSARWSGRAPFPAVNDAATAVSFARTGQRRPNPEIPACTEALVRDAQRGTPQASRLYGDLQRAERP